MGIANEWLHQHNLHTNKARPGTSVIECLSIDNIYIIYDQTHPKKDKTNLRIDCGFLLVVISNEVLIVGIADSMCSSSYVQRLQPWISLGSETHMQFNKVML